MGWGQRGKADRGEGRAESPGREGLRQLKVASAGRPRLEEYPLSCCIPLNGRVWRCCQCCPCPSCGQGRRKQRWILSSRYGQGNEDRGQRPRRTAAMQDCGCNRSRPRQGPPTGQGRGAVLSSSAVGAGAGEPDPSVLSRTYSS